MKKGIYVIAMAATALFYQAWLIGDQKMIATAIGGIVTQEGSSEWSEVELGRWLFLLAVLILACCIEIRNKDEIKLFELYRYDTFRGWWSRHFMRMQILAGGLLAEIYLIWGIIERITGNVSQHIGWIYLLYWLHISFLVAILTVLDQLFTWRFGGILILLEEGMTYLLSLKLKTWFLLPGIWGMYTQSKQVRESGGYSIAAVCSIEIAGIIIAYFSVERLIAKGKMEKWRIL